MSKVRTNLKVFRVGRGMTQEQFAAEIGYNRCHYGRIENGKHKMPLAMLDAIKSRFGIDGDELLGLAEIAETEEDNGE